MAIRLKKSVRILVTGILLTVIFLSVENYLFPAKFIHLKIYDLLSASGYKLRNPPREIKDIVIVGIDNETVGKMPHRWPYPRSIFANVIKNLAAAQAKVVAFDFVFLGKSEEAEDEMLAAALANNNKIVLASTIDENGSLNIHSLPRLSANVPCGIVTKLEDSDGAIRRNLTYLINNEIPPKGFLSWEMAILKAVDGLNVTPVKGNESYLSIKDDKNEKRMIPVDPYDKSFIINFRAHTGDFRRLSLYNVYKGDFDPGVVRNKIVLIGFVSSLLGDVHNTPIGWMPGVILNANALLTLYSRNFITTLHPWIIRLLTVAGVIISISAMLFLDISTTVILTASEIAVFFIISYAALTLGYTWDYFAFPFSVAVFPAVSKKIYNWIWQRKKFYWT